jgi:hypothetical protein
MSPRREHQRFHNLWDIIAITILSTRATSARKPIAPLLQNSAQFGKQPITTPEFLQP